MRSDRIEVIRRALDLARAALELPESEREDWLLARCGPDAALHGEAAALLRADGERPRALEFSSASEDWVEIREDPLPGLEIGRFRIAARLGSGGMGTVYRAEPTSGVARQPVALKLIKRGMDSEEIVARFVRERSILARLEHPHIARLLDGGIAGDGRPWFAMELVDGEPLIAWCDERHLGLDARIALFLDVCDAVAYAHRNLVVHRDLKPANVLVTGDGTVKLLDFGIAKLLAPDVDDTVRTAAVPLMTPEYAAPEQFERGAVTTQTDVYQLGGLLHELLCGLRPPAQAAATTVATGMDTRLRRLAADDADAAAAIAGVRGLGVPALLRGLRGDLARIVRHAMDPVAERRYPGAGALAADLRRFLRGEAVSAADATLAYRLRTFLRRHRLAVGAVAAVVSALAIGLGLALREANELRRAERATENALSLLEDVFLGADPYAAKGGDTRATDLLARARERVAADVAQQPAIAARLLTEIGGVYVSLDDREHAEAALREAVRAGTLAGDAALVPTAAAQARLAHYGLVVDGDKARLAELDEVIARLRALGTPGRAALADALGFKADHFFNVGDYEPVTALSEEALELRRLVGGERSADFAMALGVHASMLRAVGRYAPSLVPAERGYRLVQDLGDAAPAGIALYAMEQYAGSLVAVGRNVQAEPLLREALSRAVSLRGAHSALATGIAWELANAQSGIGRFDAAAEGLRSLLAADSMKGANRAAIRNALGKAELALGNATAAEHEFAEAGAILCPEAMATTPCEILRLNHTDALLALDRLGEADRELAALDRDLGDGAGKARDRWRLLRSHLQMGQGDLAAAAATLAPLLDAARAET
ncbi:serine/threonine-protein kinase, partial [Dokdonella sp.]|uniref:serine/threonine-protein kinase n=1 Tax=Dokdonella sp. TaxID=2291710 RepID=UPI0026229E3C